MNFGIFVNWLGSTLCIIWQPSAKSCYKSTRCESTTTFSFFRQFHYILFLFIFHISHLVMSVLIWFFLQSNFSKNEHFLSRYPHIRVFRKIWRVLFSCNTRFEIGPFALLWTIWVSWFTFKILNIFYKYIHTLQWHVILDQDVIYILLFFRHCMSFPEKMYHIFDLIMLMLFTVRNCVVAHRQISNWCHF